MWYDCPMDISAETMLANSEKAVDHARAVRRHHARKAKPGTPQREADIKLALKGLDDAMKPIRRRLGKVPYEKYAVPVEGLRAASEAIQKERRKLWKMRRKKRRTHA